MSRWLSRHHKTGNHGHTHCACVQQGLWRSSYNKSSASSLEGLILGQSLIVLSLSWSKGTSLSLDHSPHSCPFSSFWKTFDTPIVWFGFPCWARAWWPDLQRVLLLAHVIKSEWSLLGPPHLGPGLCSSTSLQQAGILRNGVPAADCLYHCPVFRSFCSSWLCPVTPFQVARGYSYLGLSLNGARLSPVCGWIVFSRAKSSQLWGQFGRYTLVVGVCRIFE